MDLEIYQADVEGAYLNGKLDSELYMHYPEGILPAHGCNSFRLIKSLYGLKQSGRAWWIELGKALTNMGFTKSDSDWGIYVLKGQDGSPTALLLAYVDDLVISARSKAEIDKILQSLQSYWKISSLGELSYLLGLKVTRNRSKKVIWLNQTAYIDRVIERFPGHSAYRARAGPLPSGHSKGLELEYPAQLSPYQELVGCLLWISGCTRPDVSFSASFLGRYASAPSESHWQLALRVVSYLLSTRSMGLTLGGVKTNPLECFVDADWGGCHETRRSTTGIISMLNHSPISWSSKRQATTASSTLEAEYLAVSDAVRDVLWTRHLLSEVGQPQGDPTTIHCDNQGAI